MTVNERCEAGSGFVRYPAIDILAFSRTSEHVKL